jgi:hypothetical protein
MHYNNVCIAENEEAMPHGWQPFHCRWVTNPIKAFIGWNRLFIYFERNMAVEEPLFNYNGDYMKSLVMGSATSL